MFWGRGLLLLLVIGACTEGSGPSWWQDPSVAIDAVPDDEQTDGTPTDAPYTHQACGSWTTNFWRWNTSGYAAHEYAVSRTRAFDISDDKAATRLKFRARVYNYYKDNRNKVHFYIKSPVDTEWRHVGTKKRRSSGWFTYSKDIDLPSLPVKGTWLVRADFEYKSYLYYTQQQFNCSQRACTTDSLTTSQEAVCTRFCDIVSGDCELVEESDCLTTCQDNIRNSDGLCESLYNWGALYSSEGDHGYYGDYYGCEGFQESGLPASQLQGYAQVCYDRLQQCGAPIGE